MELRKINSVTISIVTLSICHKVMRPKAMTFVFLNVVCHYFHCYPICHKVMRTKATTFVFQMLSFKPAFSLSSFTFIKRLFSSSVLSVISVASSAFLRLLIFLLAILIPACTSSRTAFRIMYSTQKLNKHSDNIHPWYIPFPVCNQLYVQF